MSPSNYNEAELATRQLQQLLGRPLRFLNLDDSPQQDNSSDCGVYVCIQMRHLLLKRLLCANAKEKVSMSMRGKLVDATGGRREMLDKIHSLRKEGERRRSYVIYRRMYYVFLTEITGTTNPAVTLQCHGEARSVARLESTEIFLFVSHNIRSR